MKVNTTEEELTEERTNKEELIEEKMDIEDIIDNYIEHIRNIAELTDEEIASVIDDAIEDDDELLNILEKFLAKRENIREKIISVQVEEEKEDEKRQEKDDVLDAFEDIDYAYPLEDIIKSLKRSGHESPGTIITDTIGDILYVDSIDDDDVYFALSKKGEALWKLHNLDKK